MSHTYYIDYHTLSLSAVFFSLTTKENRSSLLQPGPSVVEVQLFARTGTGTGMEGQVKVPEGLDQV